MSSQKKWLIALSEIESSLNSSEKYDAYTLLDLFESIEESFRDQNFPHLYARLWRVSKDIGNLKLANKYVKKYLNHLVEFKRIPRIKELLETIKHEGLLKKEYKEFERKLDILIGKKNAVTSEDQVDFQLMADHPEHWRDSRTFIKLYLLLTNQWKEEEWKYCYEFLLNYSFDKEIILNLIEKANDFQREDSIKKFEELLKLKKIKFKNLAQANINSESKRIDKLNVDYEQLAVDILSGQKKPDDQEQAKVLATLKFISESDLHSKGKDMIVAFELLGMEKVVHALCEKLIVVTDDIKGRASIFYIWAQSLNNCGEYYKTIDLIDEVLSKEPFYEDENTAFLYLKAEACLKVNKIKVAKDLFARIKKINPHYRLVGERLRLLETI